MQRIANGTQVASLPTPAAPVGTPGYGTNGDPGAGLLGSIFSADDFNRHQEELMAFLTAAGISPDGANNAQVLASARKLFGEALVVGSSGAVRLPGGIILQWGVFAPPNNSSQQWTITLPIAFPNGMWSASAQLNNTTSSTGAVAVYGMSTTAFSIFQSWTGGQTGNYNVYWLAVGN